MQSILSVGLFLLAAVVILKVFTLPVKLIFKLLINTVVGLFLLFFFNMIGGLFGVTVGINLLNAVVVGVLGPIGLVALLLLRWLIL